MARMWQSPFVRLAAYYVVLSVAVGLLVKAFPQIVDLFEAFQRLSPIHGTGGRKDALDQAANTPGVASLGSANLALITFFSMLGALALVLPVAWVYMITKQHRGYDQSVVQTVIVLPMKVAAASDRLRRYIEDRAKSKKRLFNSLLLVHTSMLEPAQQAVEAVLDQLVKRWELREVLPAGDGKSTLEYLVRLTKDAPPGPLLDAVKARGAPHVIAVEYRSLRGLGNE